MKKSYSFTAYNDTENNVINNLENTQLIGQKTI